MEWLERSWAGAGPDQHHRDRAMDRAFGWGWGRHQNPPGACSNPNSWAHPRVSEAVGLNADTFLGNDTAGLTHVLRTKQASLGGFPPLPTQGRACTPGPGLYRVHGRQVLGPRRTRLGCPLAHPSPAFLCLGCVPRAFCDPPPSWTSDPQRRPWMRDGAGS